MAYTHSKYEVEMQRVDDPSTVHPTSVGQTGCNLAVTTVVAGWGPGFMPHAIRGAAIVMSGTNVGAFTGAAVGISFAADISTPGTATHLFTISLPSSSANNKSIYYVPTYYIEVPPGAEVVAHPTTAATAGVRARLILYVEPRWELPANVTTMQAAT